MKALGMRWPLRTKKSRWFVAILAGGTLLIWLYLSRGIHYGFVPYLSLNVHSSADLWLSVNGRFFMHPVGVPPYYLEVEPLNCVFFVSDENKRGGGMMGHFLNRKTGVDITVPLNSKLSDGIRSPTGSYYQGSYVQEWVESVEWPTVSIFRRDGQSVWKYKFDLEKKTVVESVVFR